MINDKKFQDAIDHCVKNVSNLKEENDMGNSKFFFVQARNFKEFADAVLGLADVACK